jgi:hypothetical protein
VSQQTTLCAQPPQCVVAWYPNHHYLCGGLGQFVWWFESQTTTICVVVFGPTTTTILLCLWTQTTTVVVGWFLDPKHHNCVWRSGRQTTMCGVPPSVVWLPNHNYCCGALASKPFVVLLWLAPNHNFVWWFGSQTTYVVVVWLIELQYWCGGVQTTTICCGG